MPGYIEDRWYKKGPPDPKTGKATRAPTARCNQGKRWKVAGIPGVRSRSFTKLEGDGGAKAWLKEAATDTTRGAFYDPRDGKITLDEYVRKHWWPNVRMPPTTRETVKRRVFNHILPHVGALPLSRIGHDEIKSWSTRAERSLDVSTLAATWAHFSSILQAAYKAKRVPENPFRDPELKAPRPPKSRAKAWPLETVTAVRNCLDDRYRILLDEAVTAGLRQGETFGLSPDDVEITGGTDDVIKVTRQVVVVGGKMGFAPPKGNKTREAPCPPELGHALTEYAERFPSVQVTLPWIDPDRPNLPWADRELRTVRLYVTTPSSADSVYRDTFNNTQWKPALAEAGVIPRPVVERVPGKGKKPWRRTTWEMPREEGFHVLRHTFASVVLAEGETIGQLADWLGHGDPAFTLRTYVHFMPKSGKRAVAALGRLLDTARQAETPVPSGPEVPDEN
ncbi:tyrosine-type recombinase/integrase [Streptomyces sp. NPDC002853]